MKTGLSISIYLICSIGWMFGASFAHVADARSHPRAIETATRIRPEKPPNAISRRQPVSPSGLLALSGTASDGVYRSNSNPAALGRLAKPSNASPAVLAATRVNRKP